MNYRDFAEAYNKVEFHLLDPDGNPLVPWSHAAIVVADRMYKHAKARKAARHALCYALRARMFARKWKRIQ